MQTEALYTRYFPLIARHARRLLGNSAEAKDVAQETFLRFLKSQPSGDERLKLAWLYRVSANLAVDCLRKRRIQHLDDVSLTSAFNSAVDATIELTQTVAALTVSVSQDVLRAGLLIHANRLTQPEAAEIFEVSTRTIRRWMDEFEQAVAALNDKDTV